MSVTANDRRYGPISITGAGQALSVDFRIQNDADALVILYDSSATTYLYTGNGLTLNTHYTISSKTDSGFTCTFASTIGASGDTAWVFDKRDPKTYVSFTAADPLPPETLQKLAIDTLTEDIQSLKEIVGRCLQVVPQTTKKSTKDRTSTDLDIPDLPTTHTATQYLGYTTDNEWAFGTQADLTGTAVSSFMETVLDDTTAAAARTTLGLVIGTNVAAQSEVDAVIHADGSVAFTGDQSMGSNKLTNVTDPTAAQDAATKNYVDSGAVRVLHADNDHTEVSSTAAETNVLTLNVPGGTMGANGSLDIEFSGYVGVVAGSTCTVKTYLDGNLISIWVITGKGTNATQLVAGKITIFNQNDESSQRERQIALSNDDGTYADISNVGTVDYLECNLDGTTAVDTSADVSLTMTVQHDTSSSAKKFKFYMLRVLSFYSA